RAGAHRVPRAPGGLGGPLRRARQGPHRPGGGARRLADPVLVGRRRHGRRAPAPGRRRRRPGRLLLRALRERGRRPRRAGRPRGLAGDRHRRARSPGPRRARPQCGPPPPSPRRGPPPRPLVATTSGQPAVAPTAAAPPPGHLTGRQVRSGGMGEQLNRRILLAQRPDGLVREDDFTHDAVPIPQPGPGEVLVEVDWLGIDATVRTWLSRAEGYIEPVQIGEVVRCSGVGRVIDSRSDRIAVGQQVTTLPGWQEYAVVSDDPMLTTAIGPDADPLAALGVFGSAGIT